MDITWFKEKKLLKDEVKKKIKPVKIILDIGCGIRPQNLIQPVVHICCEPFGQYIAYLQREIVRKSSCYFILLKAKWEEIIGIIPVKAVDSIFLLDVIEHLDKEKGLKLLELTEKIARQQIVIFTPLGFFPQEHPDGKDVWGYEGGSWQTHRSGWLPEDFDQSWKIYACKDFHRIDNMQNKLKKPIGAFWAIKTLKN